MCKIVEDTTPGSVQASLVNQRASLNSEKDPASMEKICKDVNRVLSSPGKNPTSADEPMEVPDEQSKAEPKINAVPPKSPPSLQDDPKPAAAAAAVAEVEMLELVTESEPPNETSKPVASKLEPEKEKSGSLLSAEGPLNSPEGTKNDVVMEEGKNDGVGSGSTEKSKEGVIVLDD